MFWEHYTRGSRCRTTSLTNAKSRMSYSDRISSTEMVLFGQAVILERYLRSVFMSLYKSIYKAGFIGTVPFDRTGASYSSYTEQIISCRQTSNYIRASPRYCTPRICQNKRAFVVWKHFSTSVIVSPDTSECTTALLWHLRLLLHRALLP